MKIEKLALQGFDSAACVRLNIVAIRSVIPNCEKILYKEINFALPQNFCNFFFCINYT